MPKQTTVSPVEKLARAPWAKDMTPVDTKTLTLGLKHTPKTLRAAAKVAVARLQTKSLPDMPDEVDVEAATETIA